MIFLCFNCAIRCADIPKVVKIKSVTVDVWSEFEFEMIKIGGNAKFMNYMRGYDLDNESPETILTCKAA